MCLLSLLISVNCSIFVVQQYATHALADTTCDHSILFMIHSARKCLIWDQNCPSFSERLSLLFILRVRAHVCACIHSHTCISLLLPRTSWLSSNSYLLDTVPGISLLIVQLCRSGMATEPRHCKQKYPSWNHMQHRFWCGTEKNITSNVNALTIEQHALQGWHLSCIEAADKLTVNNAVNHTQLNLFACMPAELQICRQERISSSSIYL